MTLKSLAFCCTICQHETTLTGRTMKEIKATAVRIGWSHSAHGWLCNWHTGEFTNNKAKLLRAAFDNHSHRRPLREWGFATDIHRDWKFDFAFPAHRLAIEVDGGVWTNGGHTRGSGFIKDMRKLNAAAVRGWRVLRYTPQMIEDDPAGVIAEIESLL